MLHRTNWVVILNTAQEALKLDRDAQPKFSLFADNWTEFRQCVFGGSSFLTKLYTTIHDGNPHVDVYKLFLMIVAFSLGRKMFQ